MLRTIFRHVLFVIKNINIVSMVPALHCRILRNAYEYVFNADVDKHTDADTDTIKDTQTQTQTQTQT